jgi:hypothetical protein
MRSHRFLILLLLPACQSGTAANTGDLNRLETGLEGVVTRGPIQPVCSVDVPCDAPFSAEFRVFQEDRIVASFHSDSGGRFRVELMPGSYEVAPDPDAPIFLAETQRRPVEVGPTGITNVTLQFDTGIR